MLRQINCRDKNFLCRDNKIALESKNYIATQDFDVVTQNWESHGLIIATKFSMSRKNN